MNQNELKEVLRLHQLWLEGNPEGKRANLEGANLEGANLEGANLLYANLEGTNLSRANLYKATLPKASLKGANLSYTSLDGVNLSYTNLEGADLESANLRGSNLSNANLLYTNLKGANLFNTLGNNQEIRTIQTGHYIVNITKDIVQIGCEAYTWEQWLALSDEDILNLDGQKALEFWYKYKVIINNFIEVM